MPLPSVLNGARQCQAKSKRSGNRCSNPAAYGCKTCRYHGAHRPQEAASGESHWNYQHGKSTKKKRAEDAAGATKLLLLRDLGVKVGMFGDQPTGWPGRRPKDYPLTETISVEELLMLIEEVLKCGRRSGIDKGRQESSSNAGRFNKAEGTSK